MSGTNASEKYFQSPLKMKIGTGHNIPKFYCNFKKGKKIGLFWLLLLCAIWEASPQHKQFTRFDISSGLSDNSAVCLLQDQKGFVWIGTRNGLNRFDGKHFKTFKHVFSDSTSLINNQVNCMLEADDGKIWVGTADGLCVYDPCKNNFESIPLFSNSLHVNPKYVRTICETTDGNLWVGTTRGIYIIEREGGSFEFSRVQPRPLSPSNNVLKIFEDGRDRIWIGTENGLYQWDGSSYQICLLSNEREKKPIVKDILEPKAGRLWIGTSSSGVYALNTMGPVPKVEFKIDNENSNLPSNIVRSVFQENDESLWIGTLGGLCIYNLVTKESISYSDSKPAVSNSNTNAVQDILQDAHGGIWVATYFDGVNYYHPQKNIFWHPAWNLEGERTRKQPIVSALLENSAGTLWIGTEGEGLYRSSDDGLTVDVNVRLSNSSRARNTIKDLAIGKRELWIGTLEGLSSYGLENKKITNYYHHAGDTNSLNPGHVSALYYENEKKIWIGSNISGVQVFNPIDTVFEDFEPLADLTINCFFKDSKNRLWVGSSQSVNLIQDSVLVELPDVIHNWDAAIANITFITEDSSGILWFGTRGRGLYALKDKRLLWFNTSNGLVDNTVNSLVESDNNQIWISTNQGLSKIRIIDDDPQAPQITAQTYSQRQGNIGSQFSSNCALKSKSKQLIFGGTNGLVSFKPSEIEQNDHYPNLVFLELSIKYKPVIPRAENAPLSKSLDETEQLVLDYDQRDFSISFAGINFINPDSNFYRYKVEDLDKNWIEVGNENTINFTYFPIGTHDINVQVTTVPGAWDGGYRTLSVTVLPPWWLTWWAFIGYFILLMGVLYILFRYSQQWARLKNKLQIEKFEHEKELFKNEKEIELQTSKLDFFTDVSHELRTPLTLILAPLENIMLQPGINEKTSKQLTLIQRNGKRMMHLIDQVLSLRKLEGGHEKLKAAKGNIVFFLEEICLAFNEIADNRGIEFEYLPYAEHIGLWYDRDKMEIIMYNLLSNAIKNTPSGGKISVFVKAKNRKAGKSLRSKFSKKETLYYAQISVVNTGKGIADNDMKHLFKRFYTRDNEHIKSHGIGVGLELAKRMVNLHKGEIKVESKVQTDAEKGRTTFRFYLPMGRSHLSQKEMIKDFKDSEDARGYTKGMQVREKMFKVAPVAQNIKMPKPKGRPEQTLLVVEDNEEVRAFICDLFFEHYLIEEASNGANAWNQARKIIPDLIISDVMMPEMDGIQLCRKLKTDLRTSHIPVILLTARTTTSFKYEGLETGADEYITKPFSAQFLMLRVQNLIKQREVLRKHFKKLAIMEPDDIKVTSADERLMKNAVNYINENIQNSSIGVEELSRELGLSRVHFYRKIKSLTNLTAVEFIRCIRLKRAAMLLKQDKLSIKEIQYRVGFQSADYFRTCFKGQYGVSPSKYAKQNSIDQ